MQSVSSRIWTRVAVFISYDDNNYTTVGDTQQLLILEYFFTKCILSIISKDFDRCLITFPVWVHLSTMYHENKTLKTI